MTRYLIVTADDFGYCRERNRGIVDVFRAGGISRASLMVSASAASQAASLAAEHHIPLGLHFNLTEGFPVSDNKDVSSLLSENGAFKGKFGFRDAVKEHTVMLDEVRRELQAQLARFRSLTGDMPLYLDGHNHIHVMPGVCKVVAEELHAAGVSDVRLPLERAGLTAAQHRLPSARRAFYQEVVTEAEEAAKVFTQHGIRFADGFIGMATMGEDLAVDTLERLLPALFSALEEERDQDKPSRHFCDTRTRHVKSPGSARSCDSGFGPDNDTDSTGADTDSSCDTSGKGSREGSPTHKVSDNKGRSSHSVELMVHPGYPCVDPEGGCGQGPDDFARSADRHHELSVLGSEQWRTMCERHRIVFSELADMMSCSV